MADQSKASWPKTSDGTTDWEAVFEDPNTGFISLVSRTQSATMAEKTATVIIQKLFTRRNDLDLCKQNIHRLGTIVATHKDDLGRIHEDVAVLMREIKNERIELARVFIERKKAGAAIDRRAGLWSNASSLFKPKFLIPIIGVLATALASVVYVMMQSSPPPAPTGNTDPFAQNTYGTVQPMDPNQFNSKPDVKADPIAIWLKTVRWPITPQTSGDPAKFYSVTLYVDSHGIRAAVCDRAPSVTDRIIVSFGKTMPPDRDARVDEIAAAEDEIKSALNTLLSDDFIGKVTVSRYGTKGFKAATLPPYCKASRYAN